MEGHELVLVNRQENGVVLLVNEELALLEVGRELLDGGVRLDLAHVLLLLLLRTHNDFVVFVSFLELLHFVLQKLVLALFQVGLNLVVNLLALSSPSARLHNRSFIVSLATLPPTLAVDPVGPLAIFRLFFFIFVVERVRNVFVFSRNCFGKDLRFPVCLDQHGVGQSHGTFAVNIFESDPDMEDHAVGNAQVVVGFDAQLLLLVL